MAAIISLRSPVYLPSAGPFISLLASTRSSLRAEMLRVSTAASIVGVMTPRASAIALVHLPVPLCPALSKRESTLGLSVAARHQRRPPQRALLAARNAGADEVQSLRLQLLLAALRVHEVRVAAVNDDVAGV